MKGNKALQVSKIKSHARRMTDNRRDVSEVRPDDKRHMIYTKRRCEHTWGMSLQDIKIRHRRRCAHAGCIFKNLYNTRQTAYYSTLSDIACIISASISSHSSGLSFSSVLVASRP